MVKTALLVRGGTEPRINSHSFALGPIRRLAAKRAIAS
jgi:hypothetical protein